MTTTTLIPPARPTASVAATNWLAVAAAALAMVATMPGRTHGLGLITEPLLAQFKLDRVDYSTINLWATLLGATLCLPAGWLIDRFGSRRVLVIVVLALGGSVLGMTGTGAPWLLAVLILLTRGFGQSALSVVSLGIVGRAAPRRSGLPMAVYSVLIGVGFIATFVLAAEALGRWGFTWRQLWAVIGWTLLVGVAPVGWLLLRDDVPVEDRSATRGGDGDATLVQALLTPAFWSFALATSFYGLVSSGVSLFYESVLNERGFNRDVFLDVVKLAPVLALLFNFLGGWAGPRVGLGRMLGVAMLVLAAALLALPRLTTMTHVYLYAGAMALSGGVVTVTFFSVWSQFYGPTHLGAIQGAAQAITVLASAVGPLLLAVVKERTGSYAPVFYALGLVSIILSLAVWLSPMPRATLSKPPPQELPA